MHLLLAYGYLGRASSEHVLQRKVTSSQQLEQSKARTFSAASLCNKERNPEERGREGQAQKDATGKQAYRRPSLNKIFVGPRLAIRVHALDGVVLSYLRVPSTSCLDVLNSPRSLGERLASII